jgi:glycerol-3-phosphate dehydrogenase
VKTRLEYLRAARQQTFDVCVIGGGATGAGCALDAQLRGLRTILLDGGDFASATSSASTKLAHGGIRYLQQAFQQLDPGQFKVIRSALHERARMLHNAPHLAHRRDFLIPCFSAWQRFYYAVGVTLYDFLAGASNIGQSSRLSAGQATERLPSLNAAGLAGAVTYADGQFDDARFGLVLVQSFTDAGGVATNYLNVLSFETAPNSPQLQRAIVQDQISRERFTIAARSFVNCTGPFSDAVRTLAHPGMAPRLVRSRGVHILLPLAESEKDTALLIPHTDDGRVIFAIPWLGRLLVGTTDTEVATAEESAVTAAEAEYLLSYLNRYLIRPRSLQEVVGAFSGVRPLVRPHHARQTSKLIRDHEIEVDQASGLISVLGGKWTTYRAMAEDAVNHVQRQLGQPVSPSRTPDHRLCGATEHPAKFADRLAGEYGVPSSLASHLVGKFGSLADRVCALSREQPGLAELLVPGFPAIRAEVAYSIREEMAMSIEDVLARRLGLQYYDWNLTAAAAPVVAELLAREHGWSQEQQGKEITAYTEKVSRMQNALRTFSSATSIT